jgi:hypothetical protein
VADSTGHVVERYPRLYTSPGGTVNAQIHFFFSSCGRTSKNPSAAMKAPKIVKTFAVNVFKGKMQLEKCVRYAQQAHGKGFN